MGIVYVVQNAHKLNHRTGKLVPRFNLEPAREFGTLEFIYSPTCSPFNMPQLITQAYDVLCNYDPLKDYLLPVGSVPLICAASAAVADCSGGNFTLLQWSNKRRSYAPINVKL